MADSPHRCRSLFGVSLCPPCALWADNVYRYDAYHYGALPVDDWRGSSGHEPVWQCGRFFDPPKVKTGATCSVLIFSAHDVKEGSAARGPKSFDGMSVVDVVCKAQDTLWGGHDELDESLDAPDHDMGVRSGVEVKVERMSAPAGPSSSGSSSMRSPTPPLAPRTHPLPPPVPHAHPPPPLVPHAPPKSLNRKKSEVLSSQKEVVGKRVAEAKHGAIRLEDYQLEDAPVTGPGWIGRTLDLRRLIPTLEQVLAMPDMILIPWDGIATRPILDASDLLIALLGGQPPDSRGAIIIRGMSATS
ncbi:hypothetical protein BDZ89DRAFT_1132910 [Hymenopellis radicata]|nr:hypothetical protein BDZ89DRAFT_1132910 [Hymenopellis radicata]